MAFNGNNTAVYIDIGVNLTNSRFDKDRYEVILRAEEAGVIAQVITGTDAQESIAAYQLTRQNPSLFSTAGCHPHDAKDFTEDDFQTIQSLLKHERVVAVGECGLDFNRNFSPPAIQETVFRQQIELACTINKPLFLHERDANERMIEILDEYAADLPKVVIHCFTGNQPALESYLERDLYIGVTGWVCDERRGVGLSEIIHLIPDNRLMLETDAPYLIPRDLKPKPKSNRNEPKYLPHIAQKIAQCRNQDLEYIAKISYQNALDFFKLDATDTFQIT